MFSRYFITDPGGTDLIVGNIVSREQFMKANIQAKKEGGKIVVRFYRSGDHLKNPDDVLMTLKLDKWLVILLKL